MRIVSDVIDTIFGSIRLIFALGFGAITLFGLFITYGTTVFATEAAASAERTRESAIAAKQEERRSEQLAEGGWGYERAESGAGRTSNGSDEDVGGWGSGN